MSAVRWPSGCAVHAGTLIRLLCGVAVLTAAHPAYAEPVAGEPGARLGASLLERLDRLLVPRCLTPAAGGALQELVAAGALQPVLGSDFTVQRVDLGANQIAVEIRDRAQHSYAMTLALTGAKGGTPDGHGRRFDFYLTGAPDPANPRATEALLAVASLFDQAIPDTALARCSGGDEARRGADRRYPRALVLASAGVEVLIVLAAIVFGLRAVRARPAGIADHVH